jgi:hypothetical protein
MDKSLGNLPPQLAVMTLFKPTYFEPVEFAARLILLKVTIKIRGEREQNLPDPQLMALRTGAIG